MNLEDIELYKSLGIPLEELIEFNKKLKNSMELLELLLIKEKI